MKLKPPDSSLEDYVARRRAFMLALNATHPTPRERLDCMRRWMESNSPYSAAEKLENLKDDRFWPRRARPMNDHYKDLILGIIIGWGFKAWVIPAFKELFSQPTGEPHE